MIRLTTKQIQEKLKFIESYANASNSANASKLDANANVSSKNIATLHAELNKDFNVQIKRAKVYEHIQKLFGENIADSYIRQLESHEIYCHDESAAVLPYCLALSMYPFVSNGLQDFGGESKAPKHLSSYNGGYVNMIFAASSQVAGAVASVEYLLFFDYFARKDYGENYLVEHEDIIRQELQQVVYAINQPASARGYQSVFLNWSVFDKYYFNGIFEHFVYPDGTKPNYESISRLQNYFMSWFNKERTKALLTFPVVTAACLHNNTELLDKDFEKMITKELSEGNAFFIYLSDNVSSLSSCCRLRNDVSDQLNEFSYSLGAGGVMTGSLNVITLNLNRFIQDSYSKWSKYYNDTDWKEFYTKELEKQIDSIHKYQLGFRDMYEEYIKAGLMPLYDANFINIDKQFLTLGINGLVESAEFLGHDISNNKQYKDYIESILSTFTEMNKKAKAEYGVKFNTEFVPAENLGVKFAKWDKKDGYIVNRDCYNSYFYIVEDENINILDKISLHGFASKYLDGGSALHANLENYLTEEGFKNLINVAVKEGCEYICFNVKVTVCEDCTYIDKQTRNSCTKCGSTNISHATRVIGYLKKIKHFSSARQSEELKRKYHKHV